MRKTQRRGARVALLSDMGRLVFDVGKMWSVEMGVAVNKYYWLAAVAALVIGFQNCSNSTQFVSDESNILKATGDLAPVAADPSVEDGSENIDVVDDSDSSVTSPAPPAAPPAMPPAPVADMPPVPVVPPSASPTPPPMPPVAEVPPAPPAPPVMPLPVMSPTPPPAVLPVVTVPPPVEHDEDEHEHEMEDADHSYVCILQGPGKSVKVGIVSDLLGGGSSAAASVCMSKRACLELMSQKFAVKAAEKRGYCPAKNPNAVNMSDAEIKAKLLGR
ncbi:MAG: hypothetical protein IPJ84_07895 [Bdellovibrionales bacterium]|nr:hypothetical protein [Bdellovibrionales bacterium]